MHLFSETEDKSDGFRKEKRKDMENGLIYYCCCESAKATLQLTK